MLKTGVLVLALICTVTVCGHGFAADLTTNGRSDHIIIHAAQPTPAEEFAAKELAAFLKRSTGAAMLTIRETGFRGEKRIYVGQTDFAREQGIDFDALGPEEWIIREVDGSVIISGGRPRGTLYGVYEFLEKLVGVRFLDAYTTFVPRKPDLSIPTGLAIQDKPAFSRREIFMVAGGDGSPEFRLFQVRHKLNSFANADRTLSAELGFSVRFGSPYSTHTHHHYTKDFPVDEPEYFALRENGHRAERGSDGQVCMSNPEVRRLFAAKLREYIKQDREKVTQGASEESYPLFYSLSPNDNWNKCVCESCMALADKYDAYSGVVLDFTNAIAEDVAEDYPDIQITAGAYSFYMDVPKGIRPRENVVMYMAQSGSEGSQPLKRDTLRSMMHPINAEPRRVLEDWARISTSLGVHDYWTTWNQPFLWPHANIHGTAQTLRLYHRCGVRHFMVEDELFGSKIHNFVDLQFYLGSRLLQNPEQDEEPIIEEFMDLYYDAAAPAMKRLLTYLETRQEEETGYLASVPPAQRAYFDVRFFIETDAILREAEREVADTPERLARVRQERLAIDETMLHLWSQLELDDSWPFDRTAVLERLEQGYQAAYRKYGGWNETFRKQDENRLEYLRNMPSMPPQFEGKKVIDICGPQLNLASAGGGGFAKAVADPDATLGKAWRLDSSAEGAPGNHEEPPKFGLYDDETKERVIQVIPKEEIPRDEKYHWHLAGRIRGSSQLYLWAHYSWRLAQRLNMTYDSALPEQPMYDVHASIKLEGPAYVPGSKKENSFSVDRLILVEVDGPDE